jgi:hypothetical protein
MRLPRQIFYSRFGQWLIGHLIAGYIRLVHWSSRIDFVNRDAVEAAEAAGQAMIGVTWHGRLMMMPYAWRRRPQPCVLISRHGDGALIAGILRHFGIDAVRGSSERSGGARRRGGAAASLALLRLLKQGRNVALTPDGPRGPRMRLAPGVVSLARLSGAPIIPVAFAGNHRYLLDSWDRFHLALPFSRIVFVFGEPIFVPREIAVSEEANWVQRIETAISDVTAEADERVGQTTVQPAPPTKIGENRA